MHIRQSIKHNFLKIAAGLLLLSLLAVSLPSLPASAAANPPTFATSEISPGGLPNVNANSNLIKNKILPAVFGIIGAFALLNIVGSGLKYITSAGNPQKTSEARNGILFSVLGLAIAISAEAIIAFVVNRA